MLPDPEHVIPDPKHVTYSQSCYLPTPKTSYLITNMLLDPGPGYLIPSYPYKVYPIQHGPG